MPTGGVQPGSGRPPGMKNKATIEREFYAHHGVAIARNTGVMPADLLLAVSRGEMVINGVPVTDRMITCA